MTAYFACTAFGADLCHLEALKDAAADDPQCYFFSGTTAYRANAFALAATNWKGLIALKAVPVEMEHLRTEAYNNLGFLYFQGDGVEKNRQLAIEYWTYAYNAGLDESAYHLCHTYAEKGEATYNPKLALGYCKEALRRYGEKRETSVQEDEIVRQINIRIRRLEK